MNDFEAGAGVIHAQEISFRDRILSTSVGVAIGAVGIATMLWYENRRKPFGGQSEIRTHMEFEDDSTTANITQIVRPPNAQMVNGNVHVTTSARVRPVEGLLNCDLPRLQIDGWRRHLMTSRQQERALRQAMQLVSIYK